jgi:hypothetical protein
MSWWLSTPIQRHLHQQTEAAKNESLSQVESYRKHNTAGLNENQNGPRLEKVWRALGSTSACATAEPK